MIGENIIRVPVIGSTNDFLKENWRTFPHGTVVVADVQTAGRGRFNRLWHSPEGGLWFSILFKPKKRVRPNFYTKLCAVSIVRALKRLKIDAKLKWPNDIYVDGKKLAGILTETVFEEEQIRAVIVGIGLNVNNEIPQELKAKATSLKILTGEEFEKLSIMTSILKQINKSLKVYSKKPEALTRVWKNMLIQKEGQMIVFKTSNGLLKGKLVKISEESLTLSTENGPVELSSLEIVDE
ncbi:biotin--acetyl-CoA-carboxylase ligase [Thermotoga sp. Ku-13t]|uniref:biotin--[acetyl-CoA-carboxylase] ligase n=1 Tax=Thermotoga sp. Ku-13t TaxID=1755813 RepID=UPI0013EAF800|nr:biotin--[acetyl-CoA-carboxylase] ligase [Thermotoga sp. Ku-13t]KAF2957487.1 biotin--acetyl-CoA-carboxylase ligase [Thermotoga sp. Ku-13t]